MKCRILIQYEANLKETLLELFFQGEVLTMDRNSLLGSELDTLAAFHVA